jgi:transcription elongation GreA/GreB family factor
LDNVLLKKKIVEHCSKVLDDQIRSLKKELEYLKHDIAEDTKSSAGDKYETSREMANIERQKLADQLAINKKSLGYLLSLNIDAKNDIQAGALVETETLLIFIAVGLRAIQLEDRQIMVISPTAPLSQAFLGARVGELVNFNQSQFRIISIS